MDTKIYVTYLIDGRDFRWQMTPEQRRRLGDNIKAHLEELGSECLIHCDARWASGHSGMRWEVHKDFESWQRHVNFLERIGYFKYWKVPFHIGTKYDGSKRAASGESKEITERYRQHFM